MGGKAGDQIIVEAERVGTPPRQGEILEVIEGSGSIRYRVRWTDGHESIFLPGSGSARIVDPEGASKS